jgi:uncharacterized protein YegP (UPF0339 family)
MAAKFYLFLDKAKKFRFNLKATNGQIIASSEAYEAKAAALNGIKSIQKNATSAVVIDDTVEKKAPAKKTAGRKPAAKAKAAPKEKKVGAPKKPGRKPSVKKV